MKRINISHKKLLAVLLKANGKLDSFTLFKRSKSSFAEFSVVSRVLFEEKLAEEDGNDNILLTKTGRDYIISTKTSHNGEHKWREVPETFKTNVIDAGEPYVPNIELLDKSTFNIKESDVD